MQSINLSHTQPTTPGDSGVTLPEMLIAVLILGIISIVALPGYLNTIKSARQKDVASQLSQIQTAIQGYREEFLSNPTGWTELARITPIATNNGSASGTSFSSITSSNGGHYTISVQTQDQETIAMTAEAKGQEPTSRWDIKSCLNTKKGLSDIKLGGSEAGAETPNCS